MQEDENGRIASDSIVQDVQSAGDQLFANEVADGSIDLEDIATGAPDSDRGVLEESGLSHQFDRIGQAQLPLNGLVVRTGIRNHLVH